MSCNATATGSTSVTQDDGLASTADLIGSIILTIIGGAVLAYSMTVQRFGLAHEDKYILLWGRRVHRLGVWFMGMVLYGVANALKVVAFNLGPLSVLGSVFSILLVFNLFFAKRLLGETISQSKVIGSIVILLGAVFASAGAPENVKTKFTPGDINDLVSEHVTFLVVVYSAIACMLLAMGKVKHSLISAGCLGMVESQSDLSIRAWSAMAGSCDTGGCDCNTTIFYIAVTIWVLLSFGGALVLMPAIFKSYEVSVALPIEYGALNVGNVLSGLIFYGEHHYMQSWQLSLQCLGAATILIGIALGQAQSPQGSENTVDNAGQLANKMNHGATPPPVVVVASTKVPVEGP